MLTKAADVMLGTSKGSSEERESEEITEHDEIGRREGIGEAINSELESRMQRRWPLNYEK